MEGFDLSQPPRARQLLGEHAVEFGIDAVRIDSHGDQPAYGRLDWQRIDLRQRTAYDAHHLLLVAIDDRGYQCVLAWEVLVERADADAGFLGDPVGVGEVVA